MKPLSGLIRTCVAVAVMALVAMPTAPAQIHRPEGKIQGGQDPLANLRDKVHGIKMGIPSDFCDNGTQFIEVDWDPIYGMKEVECTRREMSKLQVANEPMAIMDNNSAPPQHICLPMKIKYKTTLPLSGDHRPLWPRFGEYTYLPPQRWVHSLEHGAIVFLYHPCVREDPVTLEVRQLVKDCLWKHIISPYRKIPQRMPYALLAFGRAIIFGGAFEAYTDYELGVLLQMLQEFIQEHALQASESRVLEDGQYSAGLKEASDPYMVKDAVKCV